MLIDKGTTGRYVAPSKRGGSTPSSQDSMQDNLTVRISNLSSDVTDKDVRDLVSRIGMVSRTFLAKDMQTGLAKGYAFVTFMDKSSALECVKKLDGHPYDSLILRAEIAIRSNKQP